MAWRGLVCLGFVACGGGTETILPDSGGDGGASSDGATADAALSDLGGCSHFATIAEHAAFLNQTRVDYDAHGRYRGIPWQGQDHETRTFPLAFTLSDALARSAQQEAERVAVGGTPVGVLVPGQNGENEAIWIDGLGTAAWRITAIEYAGDWDVPPFGHERAALHPSNGSARMGFFYHDFGGTGPAIQAMGVGGMRTPSCEVVWVMQMGA